MRTDDLIANLADGLAPVKPLSPPSVRFLWWCVLAAACGAAGVAVFGGRPGLGTLLRQPFFAWLVVLPLGMAAVAAAAALVLAVPGAERSRALRSSAVAVGGIWAVLLLAAVARAGNGFANASHWPICVSRVVAIGLIPAVALLGMLRRAAPLRPAWASALAASAAMATGAAAIQLICPIDDAAHSLLGHFGPVLLMAGLGAWQAARLVNQRWKRGAGSPR
ncbi:MAG: NrsF family protein [Vicinamibacterales bacterium]